MAGSTARTAAEQDGVHSNTAASYFRGRRKPISYRLPNYELDKELDTDDSNFGGVRKDMRGRRAAGKLLIINLLKRGGKISTAIILYTSPGAIQANIKEKVKPDSVVYTDTFDPTMYWK